MGISPHLDKLISSTIYDSSCVGVIYAVFVGRDSYDRSCVKDLERFKGFETEV